jgi:hypothetical protein
MRVLLLALVLFLVGCATTQPQKSKEQLYINKCYTDLEAGIFIGECAMAHFMTELLDDDTSHFFCACYLYEFVKIFQCTQPKVRNEKDMRTFDYIRNAINAKCIEATNRR